MLRRFRSRRFAILGLGLWLVSLLESSPALAEKSSPYPTDIELFSVPGTTPNVVLAFDTSGSMNQCPNSANPNSELEACAAPAYDPNVIYTPLTYSTPAVYRKIFGSFFTVHCADIDAVSCNFTAAQKTTLKQQGQLVTGGRTYMWGNFRNYMVSITKLGIAKNVMTQVVQDTPGVNFSLMTFDAGRKGGQLLTPFGVTTDQIVSVINGLTASGATPLAGYLLDAGRYLGGVYEKSWQNAATGNQGLRVECDPVGSGTYCNSPIQSSCQNNYVIVITDGKPNNDISNAQLAAANFPPGIVVNGGTDPLINEAGGLHDLDILTTMTGAQHAFTYTVAFAINDAAADKLLVDAATAGGGKRYVANTAAELTKALGAILGTVLEQNFTFTAPVVPATSTSGGGKLYLASFKPKAVGPFWEGYLKAFNMDAQGRLLKTDGQLCAGGVSCIKPDGTIPADDAPDSITLWNTGTVLAGTAAASRTMKTAITTSGVPGGPAMVPLTVDATRAAGIDYTDLALTAAQGNAEAQRVVDYYKGIDAYDANANGNSTEGRTAKGGDIFHSTPVVVGAPPLFKTDPTYQTFKTTNESRRKVIITGANHGVLHAFDAGTFTGRDSNTGIPTYTNGTGAELWAFVPNHALPTLKNGTEYELNTAHQYYVDASPVAADICVNLKSDGTCNSATEWKTIAIAGSRIGGRAYTALDITDTASPALLWATNSTTIASGSFSTDLLGQTWSEPSIGRLKVNGAPKYVAFIAGGMSDPVNPSVAVAATAATHVGKAFYVVDLKTGDVIWEFKFGTTAGKQASPQMIYDLPSKPAAVDLTEDGYVDHVYLGDIGGQMWRFDFTDLSNTANWSGARIFQGPTVTCSNDATKTCTRPIYYQPSVARDEAKRVWVVFGTGNRNSPNDTTSTDRFYGVIDGFAAPIAPTTTPLQEANLIDVTSGLGTITNGWYIRLSAQANDATGTHAGEKVLANSDILAGVVFFTTYTPPTGAVVTCTIPPAGPARLYAVGLETVAAAIDWTTGKEISGDATGRSRGVGSGVPSAPTIFGGNLAVGTTQNQVMGPGGAGPGPLPDTLNRPRVQYWRLVTN